MEVTVGRIENLDGCCAVAFDDSDLAIWTVTRHIDLSSDPLGYERFAGLISDAA